MIKPGWSVGFLRLRVKRVLASGSAAVLALAMATGSVPAQSQADGDVRVYGCDIHDVTDADPGKPAAIHVVAARNGGYSGKLVVQSGQPIQGLKATAGELRPGSGGADAIPATAVQVRYAIAWEPNTAGAPRGSDILLESPPAELPAGRVPVWVTVRVPKNVKAGTYSGKVTVEAKGLAAVQVPVTLDVRDFTLPDPQDYRTWVETVKSPDTLALEYKLPLWSDKHWEMMAKTMRLVADTGDRVAYVPLIVGTNYGNSESMVRWIRKGENQYEYDFSVLEKYLDTVEKNLGTPKIVMVHAWEQYLQKPEGAPKEVKGAEGSYEWREAMSHNLRLAGKGPSVTLLNPATGKTETIELPRYEKPESKTLWQPVWDGVRQRLAKHGWDKAMMVGNMVDVWPTKEETQALADLTGGTPWTICAHHLNMNVPGKTLGKLHKITELGYAAIALDEEYSLNPAKGERSYGWRSPTLYTHYFRFRVFNNSSLPEIHQLAERLISGNKRGIGHIGADFWPALKNKAGRRAGVVTDRYPESYWHSLNIQGYLLAPGPQGPVGTARLEIFREGIQECEARIAIEKALTDPALKEKLGADLATRAQDYLDQRQVGIWKALGVPDDDLEKFPYIKQYRTWFFDVAKRADAKAGLKWYLESKWQERNEKLYDLAGEVSSKAGVSSN